MLTDITECLRRCSTIMGIVAIGIATMFMVTGCATFSSAEKKADDQTTALATAPAGAAAGKTKRYTIDAGHSPVVDKTTDEWEKARAVYLRTLDYAEIEQQNNDHEEYLLKRDLIESRYHIETAETAMYVEADFPKGLAELQLADRYFNQAIQIANPDELEDLKAIRQSFDDLHKQSRLSAEHKCIYPESVNSQSVRYHAIEAQIENLLAAL